MFDFLEWKSNPQPIALTAAHACAQVKLYTRSLNLSDHRKIPSFTIKMTSYTHLRIRLNYIYVGLSVRHLITISYTAIR